MGGSADVDRVARWQRRQAKIAAKNVKGWNKYLSDVDGRAKKAGDVTDIVIKALGVAHDELYGYLERQRVRDDLPKIKAQADQIVEEHGGVLIVCITRMEAIPTGFQPYYIGLRIAGGGWDRMSAIADYNKKQAKPVTVDSGKCTIDNPFGSPVACRITEKNEMVCIPTNPTGERMRGSAELKAAPIGLNSGYARQVASKVIESYKDNPRNIGEIKFGTLSSPIQPRMYIKEDFLFYSKTDWIKIFGSR